MLCLAEGQGRNAVFLAGLGHRVTAVDRSPVGIEGARRLARERGVELETVVTDLADFDLGDARWDAIVSVFAHLPPDLRRTVHARVVRALRPGGLVVLEAYTPRQLAYGTGGPPDPALLMTLDGLRSELAGLEFEHGAELEREVVEGTRHTGRAHVVQVVARRPGSPE